MSRDDFNTGAPKKEWPREEDFINEASSDEMTEDANQAEEIPLEGLEQPSIPGLEDKLLATEQEKNELWNECMRLKADMDNLRRRTERDVANAHKFGIEKFAVELLQVVDSLERGLENKVEGDGVDAKIFEGMELTLNMMLKTLEKFGVEQLNPVGEVFNPEHHEAATMQEDPSATPNTVLAVIQRGYLLNGRLIRPAMVVVAKG